MNASAVFRTADQTLRQMGNVLSRTAVPPTCIACDVFVDVQGGCCAACWPKFHFIRAPLCPVMGTPFDVDMGDGFLCLEAISDPPPFRQLRAVMLYDQAARKLVTAFKYGDRMDIAPSMAKWMANAGREMLDEADLIVPVPLHGSRLRTRRFNQAAELARLIAKQCDVNYAPEALKRKRATRQQVGLSESERQANVSGAFIVSANGKMQIKGSRIVLVDDVYTSGATTKAATRALKRAGAAHIDVLVFAKVETDPV